MLDERASPERQISRGAVGLYKDCMGRGPVEARTTLTEASSSTICTGTLTKAEQRLVERGEGDVVRQMRRKFQEAMRADYVAMVERITDREGRSFLSDHDTETDTAIEVVTFANHEA